ncbi:hypothetical protein BK666_07200 [Pseudomonas frederiksbergensis]|uniref:Uncharacterized protein n=1 Tax=Pseudomonas frederiksbergensis TaxID=104087 RepID=A0A423KBC6_9PSED|nr:hypothetical protein BK666_07200 [Pseudomonas frederiksbergensis]
MYELPLVVFIQLPGPGGPAIAMSEINDIGCWARQFDQLPIVATRGIPEIGDRFASTRAHGKPVTLSYLVIRY